MIEISWGAIFKILSVGILTYIIAPVLLTLRDSFLWFIVNKFIVTKKVHETIGSFALGRSWVDRGGVTPFGIYGSGKDTKYYLGAKSVTPEIFFHQKEHWEKMVMETDVQERYLKNVEKRLDRLLKYYKQDEENPVRASRERLYKSFCESYENEEKEKTVKSA